ncbi:hypothetical protein DPX16_2538 [Anabarilius grahami]|uniref:Uncharacterized protein n=1 Tax=Anabarilius grahami TaxID=495550 RepID=A0A3N0XFK1_ANAGA|nr:hypothetical protein DPX16_2538 [Anabarilius grahami]
MLQAQRGQQAEQNDPPQLPAKASATFSINPPESFDFSKPQDWEKWIRRFESFRVASDLDKSSDANQVNTLIYCMGDEADDVLKGLTLTAEQKLIYSSVRDGFTNFFVPKKNVIYQRAKFNQRAQGPSESAIMQMKSRLDLAKAINMVRQAEDIKRQQTDLRGEAAHAIKTTVDAVHTKKGKQLAWKNKRQPVKQHKDKHETHSGAEHKSCPKCIGVAREILKCGDKRTTEDIYVVKHLNTALLSRPASVILRLVARVDSIDLDSAVRRNGETDGDGLMEETNIYVDSVIANLPASETYLSELREQLSADSVCAEVMKYCIEGWPDRSRLDALLRLLRIPCLRFHTLNPGLHLGPQTISSALAPCSLISTVAPHPTGSTGLPRPSILALVWHHPVSTMRFLASGCTSDLHPFDSTGLRLPSGSAIVLSCSGSTTVFRVPASALIPRTVNFTLALKTCSVTLVPCLLGSVWVSSVAGFIAGVRIPCPSSQASPWLLPPATPPWIILLAVAWVPVWLLVLLPPSRENL